MFYSVFSLPVLFFLRFLSRLPVTLASMLFHVVRTGMSGPGSDVSALLRELHNRWS